MNREQIRTDVLDAALRPVMGGGRRFWLIAGMLGALVVIGAIAYAYQLWRGLGVTGLNDNVFWGFYTTSLVAFIGISYGGAVISAILRLTHSQWRAPITRLAEAVALVSLPVGALFAIIHLGRPERLWELLVSPNFSSPVFWDVVAIFTYLVATLVFFYLPLIPDLALCRERLPRDRMQRTGWRARLYQSLSLGWRGLPEQRKLLGFGTALMSILIIPLAVSVHSVLSFIFSMTSRPGWNSTIFGPYFVVAALFSGVAAVILVVAAFRKAYHLEKFIGEKQLRYLGYLMLTLGLLYLYFTFAEFLTEGYVGGESRHVVESLLVQNYAPLFWAFVVGAGILPLLLVALPRTRTVRGLVVAAGLVVAGMWLKRFLIVVPVLQQGLISPEAQIQLYKGSLVEIAITLAAAAAIPLFLMLLFRLFPVLSVYEMEEVAAGKDEAERETAARLVAEGGKP